MKILLAGLLSLIFLNANPAFAFCNPSYMDCDPRDYPHCPVTLYCPQQCGKIVVFGSYLRWKAHEDGLAYAITGLKTSQNTPPTSKGETKNLTWEKDTGYRIGMGYILPCLCWDINLTYTRFNTSAAGETHVPINGQGQSTLWEVWGAPVGGTFITDASGAWDLQFRTLNLELGRTFTCNNRFIFRPFGGLEAVWTKTNYDIHYEISSFFQNIHNHQRFCGIGPRIGLANNWNILGCVSLFADGAFSLIYGHYSVTRHDIVQTQIGNATTWLHTGDRFSTLRSLMDLSVGVRFDACLCGRFHAFAKLAYENLIFINHSQFMRFTEGDINIVADTNVGNYWNTDSLLSLRGLTITAGIDF